MPVTFSVLRSPLLATRFVFLAFLIIINVFVIVFAIWNVNASSNAGSTVPATTVMFFINAFLAFIFVGFGVVDFAVPERRLFPLWTECVFSAVITCLQLGTSIGATTQTSTICKWDVMPAQCTSIVLLLPAGWISTTVFLVHCLSVVVFSASRSDGESDIWSSSMCATRYLKPNLMNGSTTSLSCNYDVESRGPKGNEGIAPWAQNQIRRGRDAPFKLPTPRTTPLPRPNGTPLITTIGLPALPTSVHFRGNSSEACADDLRPTHVSKVGSQTSLLMSVDSFPTRVYNADDPIPLPHRSEWVRVESAGELVIYDKFAPTRPLDSRRRSLPTTRT